MARDKYISVRVEEKVHKKLTALAKEQESSLQEFAERALLFFLEYLNTDYKKEGEE